MKIVKITKSDINEVAVLLRNYWKTRGMIYSQKYTEKYIKNGHKEEIKKDLFFIIKENNKLIGTFSIVLYDGDVVELRDFVIKKEFRRKGYGSLALKNIINLCKKINARKIYVFTFPKYLKFYKKSKFKNEGYLKDHYKDGEDLIIVSRYLK